MDRMSRTARMGHNLAASHTLLSEAGNLEQGIPELSRQGLTHGEMVAKAQYWLTQTQCGNEVEAWAQLASLAAQFAGDLMVREELDVAAGDELRAA